jgi:hypothetical protein
MQCEEFEDRLNAVLDERRRPEWDVELRLHAETCPECRELATAYDAMLDGFYALVTPEPPADLATRVWADIPGRPSVARRASTAATALAMAAGLLIVAVPMMRDTQRQQAPKLTAQAPHRSRPRVGLVAGALQAQAAPTSATLEADGGDPYSSLAKESGEGLATIIRFVPGIGASDDADVATQDDEHTWAEQMEEGLKPVTASVSETFHLLMRALPVTDLVNRS